MRFKVVVIFGIWDLLHVGHINILEYAKRLGDVLYVIVQSDEVAAEQKFGFPIIPLHERIRMLEALKCVDNAFPIFFHEFVPMLQELQPDVLVIGADWGHEPRHKEAVMYMKRHRKSVIRVPYTPLISSTIIRKRVNERSKS